MNSELKQQRREYYRSLVNGKRCDPPSTHVSKWTRRFYAVERPMLKAVPRLLNHFKLGADPEFIFELTGAYPERVNAQNLGLKTGMCVGADQNGRLVEIRPKADEFALRVLASVLEELRWLAVFYRDTNHYAWRCDPYMYDDGLGGHVHFGRKRPTRTTEVLALDALSRMYLELNLFKTDQWKRRQQGDRFGQRYGCPGDYRPQIHGYEYRTLPSWLDNPWLAYFVFVTSKLAVYDPNLVRQWETLPVSAERFRSLLAYYKGMDDDAWIAYHTLTRIGLPKHVGDDFRPRWGVLYDKVPETDVEVLPTSVTPSTETVNQLFEHLVDGKPLVPVNPTPTWSPTRVPVGFRRVLDGVDTHGKAGFGELLWDCCCLREMPVTMQTTDGESMFRISSDLAKKLTPGWRDRLKEIAPDGEVYVDGRGMSISVGKSWRTVKKLQLTRKALFSGVFPLWRLRDASDSAKSLWLQATMAEQTTNITGKQLYPMKGNA